MSRSVWTHRDAIETVFFSVESDIEDGDFDSDDWDFLVDSIRETLTKKFPSFETADSWPERESHCILQNGLAQIVISEYCGLVSLGVIPRDDSSGASANFATSWCEKNIAPFIRKTWGQLRRVATFSNGETIFERTGV